MSSYIDQIFLGGHEIPLQDSAAQERIAVLSGRQDDLQSALNYAQNTFGTYLKSYVMVGRLRFDKDTILQSAKAQSGNWTLYKFTKNFFVIDDQTVEGVTITHDASGRMVLDGTAANALSITINLPAPLSGSFYGYIAGDSKKNIYARLRTSSAIGATMDLINDTTGSFDRNVSDIVKYQLTILAGETFSHYTLEVGVEFLYMDTHAKNPYYFEAPTKMEAVSFPITSNVDYYLSALTGTQVLLDTQFLSGKISGKRRVRVSKTDGADYHSILEALKSTPDYVKIYVENGVYDVVQEYKDYYGADFWTNYDGYSNHADDPFYRGLWVSDDREIECDAWAKIVWNYDGANANVNSLFSVFATGQNAAIINAHVIFNANCRYAVHDDYATFGGTNRFIRCVFDGTSSSGATIGGGCGHRNTYLIEDCLFRNDGTYDISYHNTSGQGVNSIIVKGCAGNGQCKFGWYGISTEMTDCVVSNSKFGSIVCEAHNSSANQQNMRLTAWNNLVS